MGLDSLSWVPSGPIVLANILKFLGFSETKIYRWKESSRSKPSQKRMGRIGIVAAREAGRLDDMEGLQQPEDLVKHEATSNVAEAKSQNSRSTSHVSTAKTSTTTFQETRPLRWEDDFSVNADDTKPFENGRPLSEWTPDEMGFLKTRPVAKELSDLPLLEMAKRDSFPIPSSNDREGYSKGHDGDYWLSGLRHYHLTMQAARKHDVEVNRLLEIGCASGRALRHFAIQSEIDEVWGTDINHRHIRWLNENMPSHVRPIALPALPKLPAEDNYFDLITAYSVFTHIDIFETAFLAEIRRILKPDGLAYLTAHTESTWEAVRKKHIEEPEAENHFSRAIPDFSKCIKEPFPHGLTRFRRKETGPYRGLAFHSTDHIENVWGRFFDIKEIIPLGHSQQTVVIAKK